MSSHSILLPLKNNCQNLNKIFESSWHEEWKFGYECDICLLLLNFPYFVWDVSTVLWAYLSECHALLFILWSWMA